MKFSFSTLFFLISISVSGQTNIYHPFPDSNAIWTEETACSGCFTFNIIHRWRQFSIEGDTIIGSYDYKKIMMRAQEDTIPWGSFSYCSPISNSYLETGYFAYLRNDTAAKRVYLYGANGDTLLYDFNLNIGDTIPPSCNHYSNNITVSAIDSFFDGNNYRKKIILSIPGFGDTFIIEGIGLEYGLFRFIDQASFEAGSYLQCFRQDNVILYSFCSQACAMTLITNEIPSHSYLSFSPNPFYSTTTLELSTDYGNTELIIYNSLGQQVYLQTITSQSTTLNRNQLTDGIYLYIVKKDQAILKRGKLMIQ